MAMEAGIDKYKCSTIAEAELLGMVGAPDALLCYQLSYPRALRFKALIEKYPGTRFSCLVDNWESAKMTSDLFEEQAVGVYLDVNCGMDRSGIHIHDVPQLYTQIIDLPGIQIAGLHAYDGHIRDRDYEVRQRNAEAAWQAMSSLRRQIAHPASVNIVMGGSPSFRFYGGKENVACSPGTFFLWDAGYQESFPDLPFVPAALLLTRVLSVVDEQTVCLDLGSKAVAADPPLPRVSFLDKTDVEVSGQYEEHMIVKVPKAENAQVGDVWLAIPKHICPTVNLYQHMITMHDGKSTGSWDIIARDRYISV